MQDLSQQSIMYLPGIGPRKAEILKREIEVASFEDMLYYFPYKHIDRSRIFKILEIDGSMPDIQLKGKILRFATLGEGRKRRLTAVFCDDTGTIDLVWFQHIKVIENTYKVGVEYILFGKPTLFNHRINVVHPELETEDRFFGGEVGFQGQYITTEAMKNVFLNSRGIKQIITTILSQLKEPIAETLPADTTRRLRLMPLDLAIRNIHFPSSLAALRDAEYRLKFEELFYLQLNILQVARFRESRSGGFLFSRVGECFNRFYHNNLPFELTNAQKRVVREIRRDMNTGRQMNRLLQGDVGSGKTLVALLSSLIAIDNGFQAAIMAPTEILANQHFETFSRQLAGTDVKVALLTGSTKKKDREPILADLAAGKINIIIGTHALIEESVVFNHLGFVVIDEQHRFGVAQRAKLWDKNSTPPHVLVMTATPIPRTLAMTFYGDLDISVIDELPPGRKPVKTLHVYSQKRNNLYQSVLRQLQEGRQAYIVYPLIEESEKIDLKNLADGFEQTKQIFPQYSVSMVHGKMKPAEKDAEMQKFVNGETRIMVATTVIEVGVNVPNATVMLIENAERFGLSQLHQLRGRVGRGADQSFCVLITEYALTEATRRRIQIMTETNDGFVIAEEDLRLRGPGDIDGTQQSGIPFNLKIANLARDGEILALARDTASEIINNDPHLQKTENEIFSNQLAKIKKRRQTGWFMIS
jgi:ATP-dependent DNA helicase RecG